MTDQMKRVTGMAATRSKTEHDTSTLSFTGRIAAWSARRRWWVVAASVTMLVLAVLASSTFEVKLLDDNDIAEGEGAANSDKRRLDCGPRVGDGC